MSKSKEDLQTHLQRGIELVNQKNYPEAIKELDFALNINREVSEAYFYKGLAFYEMQRYVEAENAFAYAEMYDNKNNPTYKAYKEKSHALTLKESGFSVRYRGGHTGFTEEKDVHIFVKDQDMEIPELNLKIPYEKITQVRTEGNEEASHSALSIVILVILGLILFFFLFILGLIVFVVLLVIFLGSSRSNSRMIIGFTDEINLEQIMWFEGDISNLQNIIYKILLERQSKLTTTPTIPSPSP